MSRSTQSVGSKPIEIIVLYDRLKTLRKRGTDQVHLGNLEEVKLTQEQFNYLGLMQKKFKEGSYRERPYVDFVFILHDGSDRVEIRACVTDVTFVKFYREPSLSPLSSVSQQKQDEPLYQVELGLQYLKDKEKKLTPEPRSEILPK